MDFSKVCDFITMQDRKVGAESWTESRKTQTEQS